MAGTGHLRSKGQNASISACTIKTDLHNPRKFGERIDNNSNDACLAGWALTSSIRWPVRCILRHLSCKENRRTNRTRVDALQP
eukprot:6213905-Pleurochrysis_carterae.AAC.3